MKEKDYLKPIASSLVQPLHQGMIADRRTRVISSWIAELLPSESLTGLDVGCGDGAITACVQQLRSDVVFKGVDVLVREQTSIPVTEFDGVTLPFSNDSFDFCLLIDVIHHTNEQQELIRECLRVSKKFVIVKDHLCNTGFDQVRLKFMDWVGNKSHGVHLPYNYLSSNGWRQLYEQSGAKPEKTFDKLALYPAFASWLFDGTLHFISKIVKTGE